MKTVAMGAVAAFLMSAAPAAAQAADQDALCFVAIGSFFGKILEQEIKASPEMLDQTKFALGFYAGRLTSRFPGDRLAPVIRVAKARTFAMSLDEQKELTVGCIATFQTDLRTLVAEVSKT